MLVIVFEIIIIGYFIIKWYLICYINIYLISFFLVVVFWLNYLNYKFLLEIILLRMYFKVYIEWFRSCYYVWWKGDFGKKIGKLCVFYVGVVFFVIYINLSLFISIGWL